MEGFRAPFSRILSFCVGALKQKDRAVSPVEKFGGSSAKGVDESDLLY